MLSIHTNITQSESWISKYRGKKPLFACVLGFTETGLIPGISAAGSTPDDRKYTALADAEFLYYGADRKGQYPLPPLIAGASPVFITRAVVEELNIPVYLFNAGLLVLPTVPTIDLEGVPAKCLSQGAAMDIATVRHLFNQGMIWGEKLSLQQENGYLVIGECVVGGTTTALAVLTGLGISAGGMINSSHPVCNHAQKWEIVQAGLRNMRLPDNQTRVQKEIENIDPLQIVASVGDPMQAAVAGMAISASRNSGVLLAGGTQMLAVFALASAICEFYHLSWQPKEIVVGTTRWVACDSTGKTVELAQEIARERAIAPSLLATELSFENSRYVQLQAYEQGFVKEGMGAGGACIAAYLNENWQQKQLLEAIEAQLSRYWQI
ncbi:TIGR00303 family protein [Rivularia sp. PCC 7116]|uniref:nicotinate mononucleotide-dependent phosphoribosyltransferase CobT n=1 Tax=Rivularia sp. PCC 7116 TaxID=373994 RepID=UPI00029F35BE|nr:TIGR00303 family protein [Rivularia sp. PCC 7116]AFY53709.1 TIGR00303 family protein [Rivularia sp. PCC 7116]